MIIHVWFYVMRGSIPEAIFVFPSETVAASMWVKFTSMAETVASRFVIVLFRLVIRCEDVSQGFPRDENVVDVVFVDVKENIFKELDFDMCRMRWNHDIEVIEDQQHVFLALEVLTHTLVELDPKERFHV